MVKGKFEACEHPALGEYLYDIVMSGYYNEHEGSVDALGSFDLILNITPGLIESIHYAKSYFILSEDTQGFVSYSRYETEIEARAAWTKITKMYDDFYFEDNE